MVDSKVVSFPTEQYAAGNGLRFVWHAPTKGVRMPARKISKVR